MEIPAAAGLGVAIEGRAEPVRENDDAVLPRFSVFTKETRFIDIFNTGRAPAAWTARADRNWIKLSRAAGNLNPDTRLAVTIDWARAALGDEASGEIEIEAAGARRKIRVALFNPARPRPENLRGFVEANGVVSIEAEHFTGKIDRAGAGWQIIPGLGRTGDSVSVYPTTAASFEPRQIAAESPALEYRFYSFTAGEFDVACLLVPTQPLQSGRGLRYAVGLDDLPPQIVTVGAEVEVSSKQWSLNVLNAMTAGRSKIRLEPGARVLKIYMVDAGVVLDKIVLSAGNLPHSYLGLPETKIVPARK
jgi:hypothetical protein